MEIVIGLAVVFGVLVAAAFAAVAVVGNLLHICEPNEVLIFSGLGPKGYRVIKGGRKFRVPLLEKVNRLELTNMIIDVHVENAYSKGGIPLTVQGVANLKIGSHEHVLEHAVERLLGKPREEVVRMAKEVLEGTLRGVLAQLTPEQVNEDKMTFAETLLKEAEADLARLGLALDTMKIQNVHDDRGYLNSIGRKQSAEIIKKSRIAEARAKAQALIRDAKNRERARTKEVEAQQEITRAQSERRITDAKGKAGARMAEETGRVEAAIARAEAAIHAEEARVEQSRLQLEADVIEPARAAMEADIAAAKGRASRILEEGRATVRVLQDMTRVWKAAGPNARDIFLMQKMDVVVGSLAETIGAVKINKLTMLPSGASDETARRAVRVVEELKGTLGVDLPRMLQSVTGTTDAQG